MFWIFSFSNKSIYRSLAMISACALSAITYGCTAQQIEYQALAHNQAFSASADKILLTNIVRSSRLMPVDYTSVTEYKAKEVASGSIVGKIPFGADALRIFNSDPSVNVGPGITSLDIKDFAQQKESFVKLHEDIEIQSFINLRDAGWDDRLIETMLYQVVRIRGKFAYEIIQRSQKICEEPSKNKEILCDDIRRSMRCGKNGENTYECLNKNNQNDDLIEYRMLYVNDGQDRCKFLDFQATLSRIDILGVGIDITSTKKLVPYFTRPSRTRTILAGKTVPALKEIYEQVNDDLSGKNRVALEFVGRSTHLMVRFLGQLARAQLHASGSERWAPEIRLTSHDNEVVRLFAVDRGIPSGAKPALSIEVDGETYSIPDPDYSEGPPHKSLDLFTYVRVRLDQAYAQTKLPPSNTLILR